MTEQKQQENIICHLTSAHPYKDIRIFVKECGSLARAGYTTYLIAPNAVDMTENNQVHVRTIPQSTGNRLVRMSKTVWRVFQKARSINAELYHFHDPELIPAGLLLKLLGKKVIYDAHEDVPRQILSKYWIKKPLRKAISWTFERIENFAAKRFDAVVTATPFINERYLKLGAKATNINNYPILKEFSHIQSDWNKKENSICYVGGITAVRGIKEMVQAMEFTESKLLLAGKFETEQLYQQTKELDGWRNVIELGQLDREGVIDTLSRSKAGLVVLHPIPNYLDSLPIKMFEYMSSGIPVIASDFPLWKEIVEGDTCGICIDPMNPKELAKAIDWMIEHPEEAKQMGENGRKVVYQKYNWENEEQKLMALYKELLD